jgi:hypothetical protein
MSQQYLIEQVSSSEAKLTESIDGEKNFYLCGRIMTGDQKNLNGRIYPKTEISNAVQLINEKIKSGVTMYGELNHPDNLSIDLKNVSHYITEVWMEGSNAIGKCKILNTPSGQIVKAIMEDKMAKLGVSTRGTGNVGNNGIVEGFNFIALDVVATPSGPGCYPDMIRESLEQPRILTLAEAAQHDEAAQKYLSGEIKKFIRSIVG